MSTDKPTVKSGQFLYRTLFACSLVTSLVAIVFFVIGIEDGSVSSFNLGLWCVLLAGVCASLWAGHAFFSKGKKGLAYAALAVTAVPGIVGALFILLILITQPRWN
jgi:hypothetical protein